MNKFYICIDSSGGTTKVHKLTKSERGLTYYKYIVHDFLFTIGECVNNDVYNVDRIFTAAEKLRTFSHVILTDETWTACITDFYTDGLKIIYDGEEELDIDVLVRYTKYLLDMLRKLNQTNQYRTI